MPLRAIHIFKEYSCDCRRLHSHIGALIVEIIATPSAGKRSSRRISRMLCTITVAHAIARAAPADSERVAHAHEERIKSVVHSAVLSQSNWTKNHLKLLGKMS